MAQALGRKLDARVRARERDPGRRPREDGRLAAFLAHFEDGPEAQRIAFVTYLGDIVERGGAPESRPRWEVARRSLDALHGRIPYGIAVGNHDMAGAMGDTRLFLHLTCNAPAPVLAWAEGVLRVHPDDHVFISTHMLLGPVERHAGAVPSNMETGRIRVLTWSPVLGQPLEETDIVPERDRHQFGECAEFCVNGHDATP